MPHSISFEFAFRQVILSISTYSQHSFETNHTKLLETRDYHLCRKVLDEQKDNDWPGLSREVRDICEELGIPDLNVNEMTANHIKTAVIDHHDRNMMEEIAKSKKMMRHKNDDFSKVQNYLKGKALYNCRMAFRIRCELVKDIKCNFKDKYRRRGGEDALICDDCQSNEVQTQFNYLLYSHWEAIMSGLKLDGRFCDLLSAAASEKDK